MILPMFKRITCLFCIVLFCTLKTNAITVNGHGASGFRALYNASYVEADFNNDGYLDVFASGYDGTAYYSEIYLNNKNFTFTLLPTPIPQLSNVIADIADYNGDGFIDIAISGLNAGVKYCKIFKNNGDNTFTAISAPIENVAYGAVLWADFDNDGILDLFTCGNNQAGNTVSRMYKGGNNTFTLINTSIIPLTSGSAVIIDYNNDNLTDIVLAGYDNNGQIQSYLFKNNGKFNFQSVNSGFEKFLNGSMVSADINADGFSDIVLSGTNHLGKKVSQVYMNNNGIFTRSATANLDSLSSSNIRVGDFNNDGFPDILLTGTDNRDFYQTLLFTNNLDNTFTRNNILFPALTLAGAAIADFDNDNDIDIILSGKTYTGNFINAYTNDGLIGNNTPTVPASLNTITVDDSVTISWNRSADNETPVLGLSYNYYLGTGPGIYDFFAPASNLVNGDRKITKSGNAYQNNSFTIKNLPEGKYYWSVQSIDNNFKGSAFAPEQSFTICHNLHVGQDTTVCLGDTIQLHAGAGTDVVNWNSQLNGLLASGIQHITCDVKATDKIFVTLQNKWGCTVNDTIVLKVMALPIINLGKDTSVCYQSPIILKTSSGLKKVSWVNGSNQLVASDTAQYKYVVTANETFKVSITDSRGCRNHDTINILKNALPTFTLGTDKLLCYNDSAKLKVNNPFTAINWYKIRISSILNSGANFNFKVLQTDTIIAKVTDINGCKTNDTINVVMRSLPDIKLHNDTSICFGEDVLISANKKFTHMSWTSLNIGAPIVDTVSIKIKVKTSDQVKVVVSDQYGCSNSDTLKITKLNLPVFNIGSDTANCIGKQVVFNASTGWKRVDWYTTGNKLVQSDNWFCKYIITDNTQIWAKVVDQNNCVNYDTASVTAYALPKFYLGNDTFLCNGNNLKLVSSASYKNTIWKSELKGKILDGPNEYLHTVNQYETISAQVTDNHSCVNADTINIGVYQLPVLNLKSDTTICYNSQVSFDAGTNLKSSTWLKSNTGLVYSTNSIYTFNSIKNDTIALHVQDLNNCNAADTMIIQVAALPIVILGKDTSICADKSITLTVSNEYDVNWYSANKGFLLNSNILSNYKLTSNETIIAVAKTILNCLQSDTIWVSTNSLPILDAGKDSTVCFGNNFILGSEKTATGNEPFIYEWSPKTDVTNYNTANPIVKAQKSETYFLRVTDKYACENNDSVKIQVNPQTKILLPTQVAICLGQKVTLGQSAFVKGSNFPYTYQWSPDSTLSSNNTETPIASPKVTNTYRLIASTWKCPSDTAYITVVVRNLPIPHVSPTLTIGNDGNIQLYAEGGEKYLWRPADNLNKSDIADPVARPDASTLYTVEVIDSVGCSAEASVQVNVRNEVFVPEIFTPNGDGKNDTFRIYGFGFTDLSLVIFDKYNNRVYDSIDMNEISSRGWDGTYNGKEMESGIYRWIIQGHYADGQLILVNSKNSGIISLIR